MHGTSRAHLNIGANRRIVHVAMEMEGVTPGSMGLGHCLSEQVKYELGRGAHVRVYVPKTKNKKGKQQPEKAEEPVSELNPISTHELKLSMAFSRDETIRVKMSRVLPPRIEVKDGRLSVIQVEIPGLSSYPIYEQLDDNIKPYVIFPMAVLEDLRGEEGVRENWFFDLLNCHDWQTAFAIMLLRQQSNMNGENFFKGKRTVFTVHNYRMLGLFPEEQWKFTGLGGSVQGHESLEYYRKVCLLKAGMHADMVLFPSARTLHEAMESKDPPGIGQFIKKERGHRKIIGVMAADKAIEPLYEDGELKFPICYGRGVMEAYRELLCGGLYSLDLFDALRGDMLADQFPVDGVFRNIKEWEAGSREAMLKQSAGFRNVVYIKAQAKDIISEMPGTRPASGSAIIGILSDKMKEGAIEQTGRYILPLDAGENTRTWGIGLAEARIKGKIKILGNELAEHVLSQAVPIFGQLPNQGYGWSIPCASDNVMTTERLMVGERPLYEARSGLILFAQPESIERDINDPAMIKLQELGILMADPVNGQLLDCLEKPKIGLVLSMASRANTKVVYKNTFFMAIRHDVAKKMVGLYSQESAEDGVPLFERGLDWTRHIIEPMCRTKEEWMRSPKDGGRGWGANKEDKKVSQKDWGKLWDLAQEIKAVAGEIGVCNLGMASRWADTGNPDQIQNENYLAASGNTEANRLARKHYGIPLTDDVIDSHVTGVEVPQDPRSYLIKNSVFKKGGKVGRGCVIIGSVFEECVNIPDQTVVIGSHIFNVDNLTSLSEAGGLIYKLHMEPGTIFRFVSRMAQMSIYLRDGRKIQGVHPLDMGPYKDTFKGLKEVELAEGEKMVLFGGASFDELSQQVSVPRTLEAEETQRKEVERLLRQYDIASPD